MNRVHLVELLARAPKSGAVLSETVFAGTSLEAALGFVHGDNIADDGKPWCLRIFAVDLDKASDIIHDQTYVSADFRRFSYPMAALEAYGTEMTPEEKSAFIPAEQQPACRPETDVPTIDPELLDKRLANAKEELEAYEFFDYLFLSSADFVSGDDGTMTAMLEVLSPQTTLQRLPAVFRVTFVAGSSIVDTVACLVDGEMVGLMNGESRDSFRTKSMN
ncbi:hypothetical protein ACTVH1_16885 [Gluconobacter cerinus]